MHELESGEFRVEAVYARLAAANYAAYLGLDSAEVTALFDREFGRPDIPAPSLSHGFRTSALPALNGKFPAVWAIAAAAAATAVAVPLVIFFSGDPEEASPPAADAAEITPALPLAGDGNPAAVVEPGTNGSGFASIAALETPPVPLAETSFTPADSADSGRGEAAPADLVEEAEARAVPAAAASQSDSVTAPEEEPEAAERPGAPDLAAPLVLRAEAVDSTWVRIQWDGGTGSAEEIIPKGESRQWEAADHFMVIAGRPHGVRFYFQGQLLGGGRLGDPARVLRFRASADEVVLLGAGLTPVSAIPAGDSDAEAIPGEPRTR